MYEDRELLYFLNLSLFILSYIISNILNIVIFYLFDFSILYTYTYTYNREWNKYICFI